MLNDIKRKKKSKKKNGQCHVRTQTSNDKTTWKMWKNLLPGSGVSHFMTCLNTTLHHIHGRIEFNPFSRKESLSFSTIHMCCIVWLHCWTPHDTLLTKDIRYSAQTLAELIILFAYAVKCLCALRMFRVRYRLDGTCIFQCWSVLEKSDYCWSHQQHKRVLVEKFHFQIDNCKYVEINHAKY